MSKTSKLNKVKLGNIIGLSDTISIGAVGSPYYSITSSPYSIGGGSGSWASTYDISTSTSGSVLNSTSAMSINSGASLKLNGENADIDINGVSLKEFMKKVEGRLALLSPDIRLEAEWEELKALGDQYRALEKHILDKSKTWDILKKE
jgi:hypothetical protein